MMTKALFVTLLLWQVQLPPRDVAPNTGAAAARISGAVTASDTGRPIRGAEVFVRGAALPGNRPRLAIADADGRYEIDGLPAGTYTVTAAKTGYVQLAWGQTRPAQEGKSVQLAESESVLNIDIALPRGAVIAVGVADQLGDPAAGFRVIAYQPTYSGGERKLAPVTSDNLFVTDDRGEIRLSGLAPGEYFLGALPGGVTGSTLMNPRGKDPQTFYPGTVAEADAQPVVVGLGEEVYVAFQLADGTRLGSISGRIVGSERPTARMMRRVLGSTTSLSIDVSPDGRFSAANLAPGEYTISATGEKETGVLRVNVASEDLENLVLTMRPAQTLRGRFTFDGGKPPSGRWPDFRVAAPDDTGFTRIAAVSSDWTFEVSGVMGHGVIRLQEPPRDWFLKAVLLEGKDITDTPVDYSTFEGRPLEIVLTQRAPEVTGTVIDSRGAPAADYVVVLFADDPLQWTPHSRTIVAARPDREGRFRIQGVPPGGYFMAAVDYLAPGQERERATLDRLRGRAIAVALSEGQTENLTLKLVP